MTLISRGRHGHIEIWTLDRAERLNALPDPQDGEAFALACDAVNADMSVRCVVMTGAGRAFSAGGDLTAMRDQRDLFAGSGVEVAAQPPHAQRMTRALLRQGRDATFDQLLEMTAAMQALAHLTDDHAESVNAVLEKRRRRLKASRSEATGRQAVETKSAVSDCLLATA
jgi:enoyl-CoA hydratase/carnithine racemase